MAHGNIPKRSDQRIRRNKPEGVQVSKGTARGFSSWPVASSEWDESVVRLYNSFRNSGMVDYYEETDVEMIWQACDQMHHHRTGKRTAQSFDFLMKHLSLLGATEAERRRMRIELINEQEQQAKAPELALVHNLQNDPAIMGA